MKTLLQILALVAVPCVLSAQDPANPSKPAKPSPPSWPKLADADAERAKLALRKLREEDEDLQAAGEEELTALGAAVAPFLIARLGDREPTAPETLARILDQVVTAEYTPLVAAKSTATAVPVRHWAVRFVARRHDPEYRKVLAKATTDKDPEVSFLASLGLVGLGDLDALEAVFKVCAEDWRERAALVAEMTSPARSNEAAQWLVERMKAKDEMTRATGLRLMRSLGSREYAGVIATYLDSEQFLLKKEAINALRAVVDGDAPIENLDVFQAVGQVEKWKARVR